MKASVLHRVFCCAGLALLLTGCRTPKEIPPPPTAFVSPEAAVMVAVLKYEVPHAGKTEGSILLEDATMRAAVFGASFQETLKTVTMGIVPDDLIEDFLTKNQNPTPVPSEVGLHLGIVWFDDYMQEEIFGPSKTAATQEWEDLVRRWNRLDKRFPHADTGIISLSRVGFSQDGTRALVFISHQFGPIAGGARTYLVEKTRAEWEVNPISVGPRHTY